ncbi:hypothetical protein BWI17_04400 [Betaproteobacteria bacterium GR16-43]|nr:hypothetical protein BWI17_04400 [Betaproteobacteria bacterium GR16-43]
MVRVASFLLFFIAPSALAASIDFGGFAFDRLPYEAFARATGMTCHAHATSSTCSGAIEIEGMKVPGVALWRKTRRGEMVLAQGTAELRCDTAGVQRLVKAGTAKWGKPAAHVLPGRKTLWTWRDAAANRATFSDAPDAGRATCTLLVEDGRWARE